MKNEWISKSTHSSLGTFCKHLWPHPFVKLFPQRHWLPQRQPTALRFYTFGPFVVVFFVAAAAVALSSPSPSLPSLPLALSTVAVRFLFRLVASPLAYQKVTYLTRHKWKSKRLISSSFSSTVCLCRPPSHKSWRKSSATYQLILGEAKKRKPPLQLENLLAKRLFEGVGNKF